MWESDAPGGEILHGQWSNPAYGVIGGRAQVIFPGGDGWLYSLEPETGELLWKFDCNPKDSIWELGGIGTRNNLISTPVIHGDRVYIAVGQDPEHGEGDGNLWAIDATGTGDVTGSHSVWHRGGQEFHRTISTVAIADGLLYAADLTGRLFCLDMETGEEYWMYDAFAAIWGSPYVADGRVYLGDEDGDIAVLKHGKKMELLHEINMGAAVYTTPVAQTASSTSLPATNFSPSRTASSPRRAPRRRGAERSHAKCRRRPFDKRVRPPGFGSRKAGSKAASAAAIAKARQRLDEHVREIVAWHFDPATGCPFWLERAADLGFDPRREIDGYDDLERFGHFEDDWLRGGPVRRWVPQGLAGRPLYVFETGGSTGVPKSRVNIRDFQIDYEIFSDTLSTEGFPPGSDWLMLGPTGPRRLRLAVEHLAQHRGGISFHVDLDPRWVGQLVRDMRFQEMERYKAHLTHQALTLLRAHEGIRCIFTTPKLLESLCEKIDLKRAGIRGIFCGGTEMNAQFHRFAREELVPGIDFVPTYGNTLMGLAYSRPFDGHHTDAAGRPDYSIVYYPPQPRAVIELVDPDAGEGVCRLRTRPVG